MSEKRSNFAVDLDKQRWLHSIEWAVAVAAYAYLVYRLATYEHYDEVAASLQAMSWREAFALALAVVLMPVNMWLEAWRWKTLIPMTWKEAQRQVYYSKLAGLITPWRLGEYPSRALLIAREMDNGQWTMDNGLTDERMSGLTNKGLWTKVLSMGAVGSVTMTMAIVSVGGLAQVFSQSVLAQLGGSYLYALTAFLLLMALLLYFAPDWLKKWLNGERRMANGECTKGAWTQVLWKSYGQSVVRLLCWCVQLVLVLWALGAFSIQPSAFSLLPIYYLLVTVTPNIPIVEAGVRGAWAMLLFGSVNAALAGVLLWIINTLLPCLIWPILKKNAK